MKSFQINIPESADVNNKEAAMVLASGLYQRGKLSLGQAAEMMGLSKNTMMELLNDYHVDVINHEPNDLESDLANAKNYSR